MGFSAASGASLSSILTTLIFNPFDTIRCASQGHPQLSLREVIYKIHEENGLRGFWRGSTLVSIQRAIGVFTFFELKTTLTHNQLFKTVKLKPIHATVLARLLSAVALCPLEGIRTTLMANYEEKGNTISIIKKLKGSNPFTGLGSTLLRDVPYTYVFWKVADPLSQNLKHRLPYLGPYLSAGIAAACAVTVTHPFDVMKTLKQKKLLDKEDVKVRYFQGLVPRLLKYVPSAGFVSGSYIAKSKGYT